MPLLRTSLINYPSKLTTLSGVQILLNGECVEFKNLPEQFKNFVKLPNKLVIIREFLTPGLRTQGTIWHNGEILGFTVEDAVKETKPKQVTFLTPTKNIAISPLKYELLESPQIPFIPPFSNFPSKKSSLPENLYNIFLSNATQSAFISSTFYKGYGLLISLKSQKRSISKTDTYSLKPTNLEILPEEIWFHNGTSETAAPGCIIISRTRNSNGAVSYDSNFVQSLNKYLLENKLVGNNIFQQLVITNAYLSEQDVNNFPQPDFVVKKEDSFVNKSSKNIPRIPTPTNLLFVSKPSLKNY